jgi:hypothetical protein
MAQCAKHILPTGMNFHFRNCKNTAIEGSEYCRVHQSDKPTKPRDEGKERYKTAMYVAGLRRKAGR